MWSGNSSQLHGVHSDVLSLQALAASCPNMQLLLLGGSTIGAAPEGCSCQLACNAEVREAAVAAVDAFAGAHADRCG